MISRNKIKLVGILIILIGLTSFFPLVSSSNGGEVLFPQQEMGKSLRWSWQGQVTLPELGKTQAKLEVMEVQDSLYQTIKDQRPEKSVAVVAKLILGQGELSQELFLRGKREGQDLKLVPVQLKDDLFNSKRLEDLFLSEEMSELKFENTRTLYSQKFDESEKPSFSAPVDFQGQMISIEARDLKIESSQRKGEFQAGKVFSFYHKENPREGEKTFLIYKGKVFDLMTGEYEDIFKPKFPWKWQENQDGVALISPEEVQKFFIPGASFFQDEEGKWHLRQKDGSSLRIRKKMKLFFNKEGKVERYAHGSISLLEKKSENDERSIELFLPKKLKLQSPSAASSLALLSGGNLVRYTGQGEGKYAERVAFFEVLDASSQDGTILALFSLYRHPMRRNYTVKEVEDFASQKNTDHCGFRDNSHYWLVGKKIGGVYRFYNFRTFGGEGEFPLSLDRESLLTLTPQKDGAILLQMSVYRHVQTDDGVAIQGRFVKFPQMTLRKVQSKNTSHSNI